MKLKVLANWFGSCSTKEDDLETLARHLEEDLDAVNVKESLIKEILVRQLPKNTWNTARTFDPLDLQDFIKKMDHIKKNGPVGKYEIRELISFTLDRKSRVEDNSLARKGSLVYSFGGSVNSDHGNAQLNVFDLESKEWRNIEQSDPWPECRQKHASCTNKDKEFGQSMFVFGGVNGPDQILMPNDLWELDLKTERFKIVGISSYKPRPAPRKGHGLVVHQNILYVFGGIGCNDMWMIDLEQDQKAWIRVYYEGEMPEHVRDNYCISRGVLWAKELDSLHKYDFESMKWTQVETSLGELGCSMVLMAPNKLYFFGNLKASAAKDSSSTIKTYDTKTKEEDFLLIESDTNNFQFFEHGTKVSLEDSFLAFGGFYDGNIEVTQSFLEVKQTN